MNKQKILVVLAWFVFLCISTVLVFLVFTDPNEIMKNDPLNPRNDYPAYELSSYDINAKTILADIKDGSGNVFLPSSFRPWDSGKKQDVYPSGSFNWQQEDYFAVAKAHHLYLTGEAFEMDWRLYGYGEFYVGQCKDSMQGFDYANIIFYKKNLNDSFSVVYMEIYPLSESINSAYLEYEPRRNDSGFNESNIFAAEINAGDALQIAETSGGESRRQDLSNRCSVSVQYYADQHWYISYLWSSSRLQFKINAKNGAYEITQQ